LTSVSAEREAWQQRYQNAMEQHVMSRELDKVIDVDEASKQVLASEEIQPAPVNLAAIRSRIARIAGDSDMHLAAQILKKIG
jgi:hypothetical protein